MHSMSLRTLSVDGQDVVYKTIFSGFSAVIIAALLCTCCARLPKYDRLPHSTEKRVIEASHTVLLACCRYIAMRERRDDR